MASRKRENIIHLNDWKLFDFLLYEEKIQDFLEHSSNDYWYINKKRLGLRVKEV